MRTRGVGIFFLLATMLLMWTVVSESAAQGPIRRRIQERRCANQTDCADYCGLAYQAEKCQCYLDHPCDPVKRQLCLNIAYVHCLDCRATHSNCFGCQTCQEKKKFITCEDEKKLAIEGCIAATGDPALCKLYGDCVYANCHHREIHPNCMCQLPECSYSP